jgi:hypothetical protein
VAACIAGKVFVDCNNNHVQDGEELGVPGVKLVTSQGKVLVTDVEGKYSLCGLPPRGQSIVIDMSTMPHGSRMTTTSSRNAGDAESLFLDLQNGELRRADFAEGSCSNRVLEQVRARRAQGETGSVQGERGSSLSLDRKPVSAPQQSTETANQAGGTVPQRQAGKEAR